MSEVLTHFFFFFKITLLRIFPPFMFRLTTLRKLDLNFIRMAAIPPEIGELANLEILQLRETMIKVLPPEITRLKKLTDLDLSLNNMTQGKSFAPPLLLLLLFLSCVLSFLRISF